MLIKILEHKIFKTEPSILIDNAILVNAPSSSKKLAVDHVLLTHVHSENLTGLSNVISDDLQIYLAKDHTKFFNPNFACKTHSLTPKKKFKLLQYDVTPITVQHQVQATYGKLCLGFLFDDRVMFCSPCSKISSRSMKFFEQIEILIIDGGYDQTALRPDHSSISKILTDFKHSNLKKIYFLGTHKNYSINGILKDSSIQVDTLRTGDILRLK